MFFYMDKLKSKNYFKKNFEFLNYFWIFQIYFFISQKLKNNIFFVFQLLRNKKVNFKNLKVILKIQNFF